MTRTLGVLPVGAASRLVLYPLGGRTLLSRALDALVGATDRVVVLVEPPLEGLVRDALAVDAPGVHVVDVDPVLGPVGSPADVTATERLVLHDARCPLLTSHEIARVLAIGSGAAVGVRLVTDTVKTVEPLPVRRRADGPALARVTGTLDRDAYRSVSSPLVLPSVAVSFLSAELGPAWWTADLWRLVPALRPYVPVALVDVGGLGRRADDETGLRELASY